MKLALRTGAAPDASWFGRLSARLIKLRLVTRYPHSGIVIGETLYHATSRHGLIKQEFDPQGWRLVEFDGDEASALALFEAHQGQAYDWVSLLAFIIAPASDSQRWYCYEWCWYMMTGQRAKGRVTPEMLLELAAS